jgi:hypothetical protein
MRRSIEIISETSRVVFISDASVFCGSDVRAIPPPFPPMSTTAHFIILPAHQRVWSAFLDISNLCRAIFLISLTTNHYRLTTNNFP